jgi:cytochrome c oxidase cbb3-type subunit 3
MAAADGRWRRKKKELNCAPADTATHEAGRSLYNSRCYFCHGYSGDARTRAAQLLRPPPRNFTAAPALILDHVEQTIRSGKPGTAMRAFRDILSAEQIAAVASFVIDEFVRCKRENTRYHTRENGWPDHRERYGSAYPYVLGEAVVDDSSTEGFRLFRETCISCHDNMSRQRIESRDVVDHDAEVDTGRDAFRPAADAGDMLLGSRDHAEEGEYYPEGDDDGPPDLTDLSAKESAGMSVYQRACAYCHGFDGTGRNGIALFLSPHPTNFTDASVVREMEDGGIRSAILTGLAETSMPAFRSALTDAEVDAVIAYMKLAFFPRTSPSGD